MIFKYENNGNTAIFESVNPLTNKRLILRKLIRQGQQREGQLAFELSVAGHFERLLNREFLSFPIEVLLTNQGPNRQWSVLVVLSLVQR